MMPRSETRSRAWYVHFPGEVYANGPVRFDEDISEQGFRAWVREWLSGPIANQTVRRLPPGTQVWQAT